MTRQPCRRITTRNDDESRHVNLSWKTWMVIFVSCFATFAQVGTDLPIQQPNELKSPNGAA